MNKYMVIRLSMPENSKVMTTMVKQCEDDTSRYKTIMKERTLSNYNPKTVITSVLEEIEFNDDEDAILWFKLNY